MDKITIERETLNAAMMALEYLLEASPVMTTKHRDAYSTAARLRAALAAQPAEPVGDVVVTRNDAGEIVAVTRQDDEGRILSVIAEAQPAPSQDPALQKISDFGQDQAMTPDVLISKLANLRLMATERHVPEVDLATIDLAIDHLRYFSVTPSHRLSDARMDGIYNAWRDMGDDVSYGDLMRMVEAEIQGGK